MQVPAAKYWCGGVERLYGGRGLAMGKKNYYLSCSAATNGVVAETRVLMIGDCISCNAVSCWPSDSQSILVGSESARVPSNEAAAQKSLGGMWLYPARATKFSSISQQKYAAL